MEKPDFALRLNVHLDGAGPFDGFGTVDVLFPKTGYEWACLMTALANHLYGTLQLYCRPGGKPVAILTEFIPTIPVDEDTPADEYVGIPSHVDEGFKLNWTDAVEVKQHG
jgi:hypothetical protein